MTDTHADTLVVFARPAPPLAPPPLAPAAGRNTATVAMMTARCECRREWLCLSGFLAVHVVP